MKGNKKPKVIIAVPCSDSMAMKAMTAHAIGCTILGAKDLVHDFIIRISCDIVSSRTWLVNEAIKNGGTHIFFIDSDMHFMMSTLHKLLAHDKEIVACEYNKRQFPLEGTFKPMAERSETELYEANYAGMGCMLINLDIFKEEWVDPINGKKVPYFNFGRDSQGNLCMGEDSWFSHAARDMGFKTYIDPTIKVKHLGEYAY